MLYEVITEAQLKAVLKSCWDNGGDPDTIMVGSFNKQKMSTFTGNANRQVDAQDRKLYAAIDVPFALQSLRGHFEHPGEYQSERESQGQQAQNQAECPGWKPERLEQDICDLQNVITSYSIHYTKLYDD